MRHARLAPRFAAAVLLALVAMAALRAWTCDDALITFRVAEQVLAGAGPVLNAGERVQVFTHPLWLMALTGLAALGVPLFPGVMWVSVAIFALGLGALFFAFRDKPVAFAAAGSLLFFSRAAMDFATGGLETPLTFALFAAAVLGLRTGTRRAALAWLALLPLNRLDLLPWVLPFAALALPRGALRRLAAFAALCAPAALWIAFSTLYYGDALPNTANAKLAESVAGRAGQGLGYVVASLASDAGSLALVACAIAVAAIRARRVRATRDARLALAAAASAAIALAYAAWAGGDFMLGRFVLPALWACLVLLMAAFPEATADAVPLRLAAACIATAGACLGVTGETTTTLWLDLRPDSPERTWEAVGALDERREYLPWYGLFARPRPAREPPLQSPFLVSALGRPAYFGDRRTPVVDLFALADPLLARMKPLANSRPGHGYRPYPREFWRWREAGHSFGDARLDALASDLRLAHLSHDLWAPARLAAIARLARTPHLAHSPIETLDHGARFRVEIDPAAMYRPAARSDSHLVWLRQYEEKDLGVAPVRLPVAIGRDCAPFAVPGDIGDFPAIEVASGDRLSLDCDKATLGGKPIVARVGARGAGGAIRYDEPIPIFRPALWWTGAVPKWLTHGWRERPLPAAIEGIALLLLGAAIGWAARRAR